MDITLLQASYSYAEGRMASLPDNENDNGIDIIFRSIESLCHKLLELGQEYFLVTASCTNTEHGRQLGSIYGQRFLHNHTDLIVKFRTYCQSQAIENIDSSIKDLSCQEQSYPSGRKRKRTASDSQLGMLNQNSESSFSGGLSNVNFQENDDNENLQKTENENFDATLKSMIDEAVDRLENDLMKPQQATCTSMEKSEPHPKISKETQKSKKTESWANDAAVIESKVKMPHGTFALSDLKRIMPIVELKDILKSQARYHEELRSNVHNTDPSANQNRFTVESDDGCENEEDDNAEDDIDNDVLDDNDDDALDDNDDDALDDNALDNVNYYEYCPNDDDDGTNDDKDKNINNDNFLSDKSDTIVTRQKRKNTSPKIDQSKKVLEGKSKSDDKEKEIQQVVVDSEISDTEGIKFSEIDDKYKCLHCNKLFTTQHNMLKHKRYIMQTQLRKKVKTLGEQNKRKEVKISEEQNEILVTHSGYKYEVICDQNGSEKYKCSHCQYIYSNMMTLNKHHRKVKKKILTTHTEASDLKCAYCGKEFTSLITLNAHTCRLKPAESSQDFKYVKIGDRYKCLHCNEFYVSIANIRRHQKRVLQRQVKSKGKTSSSEEQNKICVTSLRYEGEGYEYRICQEENGSTSYKCLHCQNDYKTMDSLRKHHRIVKRKKLGLPVNPLCGRSGKNSSTSKKRLVQQKSSSISCEVQKREEKKGKGVSDLKCTECDENFEDIVAAKNHSKQYDHLLCTQCPLCRKVFIRISSVMVHVRKQHVKSTAKESEIMSKKQEFNRRCLLCEESFESDKPLMEHLKSHQNKYSVICESCPLRFTNIEAQVRHVMNCHHAPDQYACSNCPQKFKYMFVLDAHDCSKSFDENMRIVNDRVNDQYVCYMCKKNYGTNRKGYMDHLHIHSTLSIHVCHICNNKFKHKTSLRKHLLCSHASQKKYMCDTCGKFFRHSSSLSDHVHRHHGQNSKNVKCQRCEKILSSNHALEVHMRTHFSTHKYICDKCGKGFHQKGNMVKHKQVHNENRPFKCEKCDTTFKLEDSWRSHMRRHMIKDGTGQGKTKYGRILNCSYCGKLFPGHPQLKVHIRTHTNERPYPCTLCHKAFKEKSKLHRHLQTHKDVNDTRLLRW